MPSSPLLVESTRGPLVETVHRVSVAVVDAAGALVARAGDPDLPTWWRSAAKPFQALPLVLDGGAEALGLDVEALAITTASHSSEPRHLEVVGRLMAKAGVTEADLACGPHTPLSPAVARQVARGEVVVTPRWSNCSGKHTGMLALARHHGWPTAGYELRDHPVQRRIAREVGAWAGLDPAALRYGVDGCTVTCFALPLRNMALAYARFGASPDPAAGRLAHAMMAHPWLVAGTGRPCTDVMGAWPGKVIAKVGADGVYSAALPLLGLGIALKVEDGDSRASAVALVEVLRQVARFRGTEFPVEAVAPHARFPILNTRGAVTGETRPSGVLHFPGH